MGSALLATATASTCPLCGGAPELLHPGQLASLGGAGSGEPHETSQQSASRPEPYTIARMSYGTPFPVTRCPGCGLGRAQVPFDQPEILEVYRRGEDPTYPGEERARRATFRRGLERLRRHLPVRSAAARPRLLDVGSSVGFLLAEARELGFDAVGLEPSRWAAEQARRRFGVDVTEAGLEAAGLPGASSAAVTLVDVLEHFSDPFAALAEVGRVLEPGGIVYLATPDLGSTAARLLGARWWGFEPWHLWYFGRDSLSRALVRAGFEVLEMRSYARTFSLGYWLDKCRGLSRPLFALPAWLARTSGLAPVPVTIDLGDTLEVVARRSPR